MRYCTTCGKELTDDMRFCSGCGKSVYSEKQVVENNTGAIYHLPITEKRKCDIKVFSDKVIFDGSFWFLKDKDFYRNKANTEITNPKEFIGMGYLKKRSYRKGIIFVFAGTILEGIKFVIDKLNDLVGKANDYLKWVDISIELPVWIEYIMNGATIICLLLAIMYFFSKKKVVEISFINKRICIPEKSLTSQEFVELRESILKCK